MKKFKASVVLSLLTGRLYCDIGEIYEIQNHMTGQSLMTHHIPVARQYLIENHLDAFPKEIADYGVKWIHTENFMNDVMDFDSKYGKVDVPANVVDKEKFGKYMIDNSLLIKAARGR